MKKYAGYTLVELMIVITIVGIMISFAASGYSKSRERQVGQSAAEQIISILQENQTIAKIGDKNCDGKFTGQQVTFSGTNTVQTQSLCDPDPGTPNTAISIPGITFITTATIVFNPLSLGTKLTTNPQNIDFRSENGTIYRIELNRSGTIEYKGIQ